MTYLNFSNRKIPYVAQVLNHHKYSMTWLPVSPKWRSLRKIVSLHLFTKKSLDATELLRQAKVNELLEYVEEIRGNGQAVEIARATFTTVLNSLSNTCFSFDLTNLSSESSHELRDLVWAFMEANGKTTLADYFPILGHFDLFGIIQNGETSAHKFFAILEDIIEKKLSSDASTPSDEGDVLSTLLEISQEDGSDLNLDDIKHLLLVSYSCCTNLFHALFYYACVDWFINIVFSLVYLLASVQLQKRSC